MKSASFDVLVCGVGGQGVVALAKLLAVAGQESPGVVDVVGSETRGVAQREGVVAATVRWVTDEAAVGSVSPRLPRGSADLVVALELHEAFRHAGYYHPDAVVLVDDLQLLPKAVPAGAKLGASPVDELVALLKRHVPRTRVVPAHGVAVERFGDYVQAGVLAFCSLYGEGSPLRPPVTREAFERAVARRFPGKSAPLEAVALGASCRWTPRGPTWDDANDEGEANEGNDEEVA
ncbi:MAG: hypothetical protein Kow0069_09350 [Promethearchaeota archaeon]